MTQFDAVVIGMGPGGEVAASRLLAAGKQVAVVEAERIGGECAYWACIPSKTLLRATDVVATGERTAGVRGVSFDWASAAAHRDFMVRSLDDSRQVAGYRALGAVVIQGSAQIAGPGRVQVGTETLETEQIILATGSVPEVPEIKGLDRATVWTNREATALSYVPKRTVVIGGGPVGVELGQFLQRAGSSVTLIQRSDRLLQREEPPLAACLAEQMMRDGIDIRLNCRVLEVLPSFNQGGNVVVLSDSTKVTTDVVVVATGRIPRTSHLGLESLGTEFGPQGQVLVDETCRVASGVWAVGDVTGVMPFTHVAKYQARVVADAILGDPQAAFYEGIPRCIFTDPEAAAVGLTRAQAKQRGIDFAYVEVDLAASLARPWTYEQDPRGKLGVVVDRARDALIGAWAVAPLASEWIHQASLAIRANIPLRLLRQQVAQFPTYSEAYLVALEQLDND